MSEIVGPSHRAGFEYVRTAATDTTGRVFVVHRRPDVALGGMYEFPGSRVEKRGDVLRPLVAEREVCNKFGLVVRAANKPPFEGGVGVFRSFTYRAKILGGDPVYDADTYQRSIMIEPDEALKFSEFLTPECLRVMSRLAIRDANQEQPLVALQQAA